MMNRENNSTEDFEEAWNLEAENNTPIISALKHTFIKELKRSNRTMKQLGRLMEEENAIWKIENSELKKENAKIKAEYIQLMNEKTQLEKEIELNQKNMAAHKHMEEITEGKIKFIICQDKPIENCNSQLYLGQKRPSPISHENGKVRKMDEEQLGNCSDSS